MLITMVLAMAAAEPIDCPPVGSVARERAKLAGEVCRDEPPPKPEAKAKRAPPFKERALTPSEKAQIVAAADLVLFDGASARWQWGPRKDADTYCGSVNAKNRFGAYVGWRPFYFFQGKIGIVGDDGSGRIVYETICSTSGYIDSPQWLKDKAG